MVPNVCTGCDALSVLVIASNPYPASVAASVLEDPKPNAMIPQVPDSVGFAVM